MALQISSASVAAKLIEFPGAIEVTDDFPVSGVSQAGSIIDADIHFCRAEQDMMNNTAARSKINVAKVFRNIHSGRHFDVLIRSTGNRWAGKAKRSYYGSKSHLKSSRGLECTGELTRLWSSLSSGRHQGERLRLRIAGQSQTLSIWSASHAMARGRA